LHFDLQERSVFGKNKSSAFMIKNILLAVLAAGFIALFAQLEIEIPLNEAGLSITGQTFAILLAAFFLGGWYGFLAVVIYVAAGVLGLPVFAGGASGLEKIYGDSGGYLVGFMFAASVVGSYGDRGWRSSLFKCILAMLIGTLLILLFGVIKLSFIHGLEKALEIGFYPFLLGGLVKVILGGVVAYLLEKGIKKLKASK
jgi:biotin transport system substrate-specific component